MRTTKLWIAATLTMGSGLAAAVWAVDESVDVLATFRQAVALTEVNNVNFTTGAPIEFSSTPAGTDFVRLATDDSLVYNGVFSGPANGQAGEVTINGSDSALVYVSCSDQATMRNAGGNSVLVNMQIKMNTGGNWAAGTDCNGVADSTVSYSLQPAVADTVLLGGQVIGNATITGVAYSTALAGGVPAVLRVVYQ